jgi:SAM-dependent methyltransferase
MAAVFNEIYAEQYDILYSSKNYHLECNVIEEAFKLYCQANPATILDVGCGTGGHVIEMARRGYETTGVDLSQSMLDIASSKINYELFPINPKFFCGDIRNFKTNFQYDAAIMMFAVIGYLTTNQDVLAGLKNVRKHLKKGALLICDFWSGPSVLASPPVDRLKEIDTKYGKAVRLTKTFLDPSKHIADVTFKIGSYKKGKFIEKTSEMHRIRYFFPLEFELFLSCAGFKLINISAFPSLNENLKNDKWNALVVAVASDF